MGNCNKQNNFQAPNGLTDLTEIWKFTSVSLFEGKIWPLHCTKLTSTVQFALKISFLIRYSFLSPAPHLL